MTEHVIPNTNPDLMVGYWIDKSDPHNPSELDVHPIIGFVVLTTSKRDISDDYETVDSLIVSVLTPAHMGGFEVDHEQFRFYDRASGQVYNQIGDPDEQATEYMRNHS